jgi:ribosomal protein S18 acetylase RimI-like enzyme
MNDVLYAPLQNSDYPAAMDLWNRVEGVRATETAAEFEMFLARNPGLSIAARSGEKLIGAVMCGHDGRRGYLYHLAVDPAWARKGIGREIVSRCLVGLKQEQISRCTIFVIRNNELGKAFWLKNGWFVREDLEAMAFDLKSH